MYITKEQLKERLNKTDLLVLEKVRKPREKVIDNEGGEKRLTHEDRTMIGVLSQLDFGNGKDTQKNIADLVGVSSQTVSNVSRNLTSPTIGVDSELKKDVEEKVENIISSKIDKEKRIQDQLITNLAAALGHVANNIQSTDAPEASKIAVDMSRILDRVNGSREDRGGNKTAIIINVPSMKEEKSFQTITV